MEDDFYRGRLTDHGFGVVVPDADDRRLVDRIIFDELCKGVFSEASRREFVRIVEGLSGQGAQAVILGCTELGLLIRPEDTHVPLLDTCRIHAVKCVELALA